MICYLDRLLMCSSEALSVVVDFKCYYNNSNKQIKIYEDSLKEKLYNKHGVGSPLIKR